MRQCFESRLEFGIARSKIQALLFLKLQLICVTSSEMGKDALNILQCSFKNVFMDIVKQ